MSAKDSYDNYNYLFRINTSALKYRDWGQVGFDYQVDCVGNCFLYTDNADVNASEMIAIVCLQGGVGRSYELLIMSPVGFEIMEAEDRKGSRQFLSIDAWIKKYPKPAGANKRKT